MTPRQTVLVLVVALCAAASFALGVAVADRAERRAPVEREGLAEAKHPRGAPGRVLGLSRVIVQPGAELALHRHQGTQIARIERGTLTYTVREGSVTVRRGDTAGPVRVVRRIEAGETAPIRAGQWIVEQPTTIHRAANRGDRRIVISIATLLRRGAPPSIPVDD